MMKNNCWNWLFIKNVIPVAKISGSLLVQVSSFKLKKTQKVCFFVWLFDIGEKSRIWFDMKYFTWYNPFKREKRIISLLSSTYHLSHFFLSLQLLRIRYRVSLFSQKPKISKGALKATRQFHYCLFLFKFDCDQQIIIRLAEILFYCSKLRIEMALILPYVA